MKKIIAKLKNQQNLNEDETYVLQTEIISGKLTKEQIIGIFKLFEVKSITDEELMGIVKATRDHMTKVDISFDCLDNCGTGGDKLNTFNISTVSALVCASAGIPVAKHGNRAASSKCGSADILEALGATIILNSTQVKKCLEETGMVFMFAPLFHPALKHVKEARIEYEKPTYFNIIGPMLNPAGVKYQVIGVAVENKINLMGNSLIKTGSKKIIIVHGHEGMDEISVENNTEIYNFQQNGMDKYEIDPKKFGLQTYSIKEIEGGDINTNKKIFINILENRACKAQKNAALLNSATGMVCFGKAKDFAEGIELAREQIESGKALKKLKEFIEVTKKL